MKVRSNNYAASGAWCLVCGGGVVFAKMTGHRSLIEYSDPRLAAAQPRTGMGTTHRLQATPDSGPSNLLGNQRYMMTDLRELAGRF